MFCNILGINTVYATQGHSSNVAVGHIMISRYCWHSNVNKLIEIRIGSEQNLNSLRTICFKGRPWMVPHYAEAAYLKTILLFFSHKNSTHEKISYAFYNEKFYSYWNVHQKNDILAKNNMEKLLRFFPPKIRNQICFSIS